MFVQIVRSVRRIRENYNHRMARGWESKSVEAQQEDASSKSSKRRPKLSPETAARLREYEGVRLARQRVLQQLERSQNPRHRQQLQDELAVLDEKLIQLQDVKNLESHPGAGLKL